VASSPASAPAATWLDCAGLAQVLGVSKFWVQERVTAKQLPHHRIGRLVRFSPDDVRAIERSTAVAPADRPARLRNTG
jgi:excisionase family DNA binding protein